MTHKHTNKRRADWQMLYRSLKSAHGCRRGAIPSIKLEEKSRLRNQDTWHVTCSPRPPTLSQRHIDYKFCMFVHTHDAVIYSKFHRRLQDVLCDLGYQTRLLKHLSTNSRDGFPIASLQHVPVNTVLLRYRVLGNPQKYNLVFIQLHFYKNVLTFKVIC